QRAYRTRCERRIDDVQAAGRSGYIDSTTGDQDVVAAVGSGPGSKQPAIACPNPRHGRAIEVCPPQIGPVGFHVYGKAAHGCKGYRVRPRSPVLTKASPAG